MRRTSLRVLVALFVVVGLLSWALLVSLDAAGVFPQFNSWYTAVFAVVVSAWLLWRGRAVKKLKEHEKTTITAVGAARVVAAAKAAALTGAIVAGIGAGLVATYLPHLASPLGKANVVDGAVTVLASAGMTVVALVVERWCEIPPPSDETPKQAAEA